MHFTHPDIVGENPQYTRNMTQADWEYRLNTGFENGDVLVIPEIVTSNDASWMSTLVNQSANRSLVVIRWVLGKHDNGHEIHQPQAIQIGSTNWIRKQHLSPGNPSYFGSIKLFIEQD